MTRPPRYALIGATRIGAYHLAAIREMEKDGLAHLAAVVDPVLADVSELQDEPGSGWSALLPGTTRDVTEGS